LVIRDYTLVLSLTFILSGFLWFLSVLLQDIKLSLAACQQQDLESKKKAIEDSIHKFFERETNLKERLIPGIGAFNVPGLPDLQRQEKPRGFVNNHLREGFRDKLIKMGRLADEAVDEIVGGVVFPALNGE
jgi:hypothetical protein